MLTLVKSKVVLCFVHGCFLVVFHMAKLLPLAVFWVVLPLAIFETVPVIFPLLIHTLLKDAFVDIKFC